MNAGDSGQGTVDRWEGDGKMCRRKESLFSLHLACAIFPTGIFKLHGEGVSLWVQKYKFFFHLLS